MRNSATRTVMTIFGTRPEAIKMAPLVRALQAADGLRVVTVVTGQHRHMLDQVTTLFGITPDHDLDIIRPRQELAGITTSALLGLSPVLRQERPDAVVVQGDTSTCFAAALAAFYQHVPVVHLEAGLRTATLDDPFPEEANRRLTSRLTRLHLAPTPSAARNLQAEGISDDDIVVTGNTVIDALLETAAHSSPYPVPALEALSASGRRIVLVTAHRRESWGDPMRRISAAVGRVAAARPDVSFVLPAHLNPVVRESLLPGLHGLANVHIVEPLDYPAFVRMMRDASVILTDSGGVQEEAPSLGRPVLVMRAATERPEAVAAGAAKLVGTDDRVVEVELLRLLDDADEYARMARAINPYGDGHAAERAAAAVLWLLGDGKRPDPFTPPELPLP